MEREIGYCEIPRELFSCTKQKAEPTFAGNKLYDLYCFAASGAKGDAVQFHLAAAEEGEVVTLPQLNANIREYQAAPYFEQLEEALLSVFARTLGEEVSVKMFYGDLQKHAEDEPLLERKKFRFVFLLKHVGRLSAEEKEKIGKQLKGELANWMDEVGVAAGTSQEKRQYEKEFHALVDVDLMSHDVHEGNYEPTMCVISVILAILGAMFSNLAILPITCAVFSGFTAFRAYRKKDWKIVAVCAICMIVGLCFAYVGWMRFKQDYKIDVSKFQCIFPMLRL